MSTDHKPLTFAITSGSDLLGGCHTKFHIYLTSEFTTDLRHVRGKQPVVAYAFSRVQLNKIATSFTETIDYNVMVDDGQMDNEPSPPHTAFVYSCS